MNQRPANLPAEIVEYIVDFLHDDKQSLKACNLSCRVLRDASRHHLFHSINLANFADTQHLLRILKNHPILGSVIYNITFDSFHDSLDPQEHNAVTKLFLWRRSKHSSSTALLLSQLSNIKTVTLKSWLASASHSSFKGAMKSINALPMTTITTLVLGSLQFITVEHVIFFISAFTNIEVLSFSAMVRRIVSSGSSAIRAPPKLLSLSLWWNDAYQLFFPWFKSYAPQIHQLRIIIGWGRYISQAIKIFAPHITSLEIHLQIWYLNHELLFPSEFSMLTHLYLRPLRLSIENDWNEWLHNTLQNVKCPHLTTFSMLIWAGDQQEFDWTKFEDEILSFTELTTVEFLFRKSESEHLAILSERFEELVPRLRDHGLLRFKYAQEDVLGP